MVGVRSECILEALVCTDFVLISSQCVPCVLLELRCLVIEVTY